MLYVKFSINLLNGPKTDDQVNKPRNVFRRSTKYDKKLIWAYILSMVGSRVEIHNKNSYLDFFRDHIIISSSIQVL